MVAKAVAFVFIFMRYLVATAAVVAVFVFMRCCGSCGGCGGCFRFHAVLQRLFLFSFIWAVLADWVVRGTFGPNGPAWAVRAAWQQKVK